MYLPVKGLLTLVLLLIFSALLFASPGQEGATFLEIPVGARPAALGSAYTTLAEDGYAPVWNPAGLGFLKHMEITGQHINYLDSIYYEYASFVLPLQNGAGIGASAQYLGTKSQETLDDSANVIGSFSSSYGAYSLAYGQPVTENVSLGVTAKFIRSTLSDVSAQAYAVDGGLMCRATPRLRFAGVIQNVGTKLKYIKESDPLPLTGRVGIYYKPFSLLQVTVDGVYRKSQLTSVHTGVEITPLSSFNLRAGYHTDTVKGLSPLAGLTAGFGLHLFGQEFSYAWVPFGDLGNTHYFSLQIKWGRDPFVEKLNVAKARKEARSAQQKKQSAQGRSQDDYELIELLDHTSRNRNR